MPGLCRLLLAIAISVLCTTAWAGCRVSNVAEMPMTVWHNHIYVPVGVNGTPGQFVLDTGAFNSMLDSTFAARAGVRWDRTQPPLIVQGVGGLESHRLQAGHIRMLKLGGADIQDREMPMSDIGMPQPSGGHADGLLGADMLNLLDLELDFPSKTVRLWRLFGCSDIAPVGWAGDYASIPMHRQASKHVKIPIWLDGIFVDAFLDTGADGLLIDRATALKAGASQDELAHDPVAGGIGLGGRALGRMHRFHMLLIGKDVYHDVPVFVTNDTSNAPVLVGLPFLRGHRVWISYGTETLFLQSLPK